MTQVKVSKISNLVAVTETPTRVEVQRPSSQIVEVTAPGPQGPPFAGSTFFNTAAIGALTSGNRGQVLEFDGTQFSPTDELENDLTITGGNF